MEEEKIGGESSSSFAPVATGVASSSAAVAHDRRRFFVELRPGETTIVSWKKLIKDANKANRSLPSAEPPIGAHPALESRIAPRVTPFVNRVTGLQCFLQFYRRLEGVVNRTEVKRVEMEIPRGIEGQPVECEAKDAPPSNRYSAVIEKIERLYMGNQSSDEAELDDVPDDDQYDTEDSFIDDVELDEYFQVDKSPTKHSGFFVNRGKLERINEPISSPIHQQKKRRRKDLTKACGEKDGEHVPNNNAKMGNVKLKTAARTASLVGNKSYNPSQSLAVISEHYQDGKVQNQLNAPVGHSKKKSADSSIKLEHSLSSKFSNRDASVCPVEVKDIDKQKTGIVQPRELGSKLKVANESSDAVHQIYRDKIASTQLETQSRKSLNDMNELELSTKVRKRDKNGSSELPDLNSSGSKYLMQTAKTPSMHVKEASSVRPKGTMLERTIRELEKMVAESRPPIVELQDADTSSQAVKRRLPREIKQKLAKVARLAQSSQGKISEELINRLMSILGHLVQLKTLKRNLKEMVELGLSAKQEKDDRYQQIKKEVIEMIRMRAPFLKSKVSEQQDGTCDYFQEVLGSEEKGFKGKYSMDNAMEDKICDLYDLYVEGMDEDKGPQIRKLYVELAELWPSGCMDNHRIKNAVCRAKERKRALYNRYKDQEKIKRKKLSTPRTEEIVRGEARSIAQPRFVEERLVPDSSDHALLSPNRMASNMTAASQRTGISATTSHTSTNGITLDRPKQEKIKVNTISLVEEVRRTEGALVKKKVQRKPESYLGEIHLHPEKLPSQQGKERHKYPKHAANYPHKPSLQSASLPSYDQPS